MNILIVSRYYWPDKSPCSSILHDISRHLAKNMHNVDVLSSQPSYHQSKNFSKTFSFEVIDNVNIRRILLLSETYSPIWRIINSIYLGIWILLKSILKKYDIIIATTIPPILNGFFSSLASKLTKKKFIYFCMDLNPEIGKVSKDFKNKLLYKLLLKIDDWSCLNANLVLVHSQDMLQALRQRPNGRKYNIKIINNFSPQALIENESNINFFTKSKKKLNVIYTGNIGRFQGLEIIIDAMRLLFHRKDIELIMIGDGVKKKELVEKSQKKNLNIKFFDYQSSGFVKNMIKNSDICLVSLIPGIYKFSYPSKIMTYLEQGKPIISNIEEKSEIVKHMKLHGYGFHPKSRSSQSIANLLIRLADDNKWKKKIRHSALQAFNKNFSPIVILNKWSNIINYLQSLK